MFSLGLYWAISFITVSDEPGLSETPTLDKLEFSTFFPLFFSSLSMIFDVNTLSRFMPVFGSLELIVRLSHVYSLVFLPQLKYYQDTYSLHRTAYPLMMTLLESAHIAFNLSLYSMKTAVSFPVLLASFVPSFLQSGIYLFSLGCFISKQILNCLIIVNSISLWSDATNYDGELDGDIDAVLVEELDEHIRDAFSDLRPGTKFSPQPSPVQMTQTASSLTLPAVSNKKVHAAKKVSVSDVHDYDLRDGSSLAHLEDRLPLVHRASAAHRPSPPNTANVGISSPVNAATSSSSVTVSSGEKTKKRKAVTLVEPPSKTPRKTPAKMPKKTPGKRSYSSVDD